MDYQVFSFDKNNEVLLAQLAALGFDSFEEKEDGLVGYVSDECLLEEILPDIQKIAQQHNAKFRQDKLEDKNWNAAWESSFRPVDIDGFCVIKATFHPSDLEGKYTITIDPKMAFGTGHHETTYMMVSAMKNLNFEGRRVLDYGCGTGVLAIMSEMLGAASIDAIDYDIHSVESTLENSSLNECKSISTHHGELSDLPGNKKYDVVLANINRNVLLQNRDLLLQKISPHDGHLLLSGILEEDKNLIIEAYADDCLQCEHIWQRGQWLCLHFIYNEDRKVSNS